MAGSSALLTAASCLLVTSSVLCNESANRANTSLLMHCSSMLQREMLAMCAGSSRAGQIESAANPAIHARSSEISVGHASAMQRINRLHLHVKFGTGEFLRHYRIYGVIRTACLLPCQTDTCNIRLAERQTSSPEAAHNSWTQQDAQPSAQNSTCRRRRSSMTMQCSHSIKFWLP